MGTYASLKFRYFNEHGVYPEGQDLFDIGVAEGIRRTRESISNTFTDVMHDPDAQISIKLPKVNPDKP